MVEFPDYGPREEAIRTVGQAELLRKRGRKILRFRRTTWGSEDDVEFYERCASHFDGRILSVGLGMGNAADVILAQSAVTELVSYELEQEIVDVYTQEHASDPNQSKHTIIVADAHQNKPSGTFDIIFYELELMSQVLYGEGVAYLTWAWQHLNVGGSLLLRYTRFSAGLVQQLAPPNSDVTIISRATGMKPNPEYIRVRKTG